MKRILQDASLNSDLEVAFMSIKNVASMLPVPDGLVSSDDPQLNNPRVVPNGSVTNSSVSPTAGIAQGKLNLNGNIPSAWLGNDSNQAARGDLVEYVSRKNAAGGYAGLDANGLTEASQLPSTGPGAGTLNTLKLAMPIEFKPASPIVEDNGSFNVEWEDQPNNSWLGVAGPIGFNPVPDVPSFLTKQIPPSLMPDIDATKFSSGTFALTRLPIVTPLGVGHAKGMVPDPGGLNGSGDVSDYMARDGTWRRVNTDIPYQPMLPNVQITLQYYQNDLAMVTLFCPQKHSRLFYLIQDIEGTPIVTPYMEAPKNPLTISVTPRFTVLAYAAKAGYNNSIVTSYMVPTPPNE